MKNYTRIVDNNGFIMPARTIRRLKHVISAKGSSGLYHATTPSGNIHIWNIVPNGFSPKQKSAKTAVTVKAQIVQVNG